MMDTTLVPHRIPSAAAAPQYIDARPALDITELQRHMAVRRRKVRAGEYLYRNGQPFRALFLVCAGFVKTCELAADGREQVTGFHLHGDLLGVESIGLHTYSCDAVALEDGEIWELPYPPVLGACQRIPTLQARLTEALAVEVRRNRNWMLAIGTLSAENRVAAFLLDLGSRLARLGFSSRHFILRMGRTDIASFLAIKHETVSRALTRLEALGYISVRCREVRLLDRRGLTVHAGLPHTIH